MSQKSSAAVSDSHAALPDRICFAKQSLQWMLRMLLVWVSRHQWGGCIEQHSAHPFAIDIMPNTKELPIAMYGEPEVDSSLMPSNNQQDAQHDNRPRSGL